MLTASLSNAAVTLLLTNEVSDNCIKSHTSEIEPDAFENRHPMHATEWRNPGFYRALFRYRWLAYIGS